MISSTITVLLFLILITVSTLVIITRLGDGEPELFGKQLKVVLSGSMEPTFQTGSIIAVEEYSDNNTLKNGDVITFVNKDETLVTHRIIDIVESGEHTLYETKGDNNNAADNELVQQENVVAVYTGFTIPYIGYAVDYMQTPFGSALLLIIPGLLLVGYGIVTVWQIIIELDRKSKKVSKES
ncbi:signal peptidase I SipW [Gracilibacillus kekensis]|uniref:Signal peptidase I n=1 Tax=Gracilibacillus kekensis TaxID=1027249 RepID=A0A1M7N050_9BACI|nr:Signal peptidase I Serine peptidase. MEROPS family S26B [Gracilibacillus kekensis]